MGLMGLMNEVKSEEVVRIYIKGLVIEIKGNERQDSFDVTIRKEWNYSGFENKEEAVEFAGKKSFQVYQLLRLKPLLEKIDKLTEEYQVTIDELIEIAKDALEKEGRARPKLPLPPNFLWTSEEENTEEQDISSNSQDEASESSEAS